MAGRKASATMTRTQPTRTSSRSTATSKKNTVTAVSKSAVSNSATSKSAVSKSAASKSAASKSAASKSAASKSAASKSAASKSAAPTKVSSSTTGSAGSGRKSTRATLLVQATQPAEPKRGAKRAAASSSSSRVGEGEPPSKRISRSVAIAKGPSKRGRPAASKVPVIEESVKSPKKGKTVKLPTGKGVTKAASRSSRSSGTTTASTGVTTTTSRSSAKAKVPATAPVKKAGVKRAASTSTSSGAAPSRPPRKIKAAKSIKTSAAVKKAELVCVSHSSHPTIPGTLLSIGQGDVGQLGLGEDVVEKKRAAVVPGFDKGTVIQVAAGGMHSACLSVTGEVWTFGCNDEGALGRVTKDDDEEDGECVAHPVGLAHKVVMISAGDGHTAALTTEGKVFAWGTFRDINGPIGLVEEKRVERLPVEVPLPEGVRAVMKVASGNDHLLCLTDDGLVLSMGCAEQGQLGRVPETSASRQGGRKGLTLLLTLQQVHFAGRSGHKLRFVDVWAGTFVSIAKERGTGKVHAWGLNNYFQLGVGDDVNRFAPVEATGWRPEQEWKNFAAGEHHTIGLTGAGEVSTVGRGTYGQLGLGVSVAEDDCEAKGEVHPPAQLPVMVGGSLAGLPVGSVAACSSVSFARSLAGSLYAWGIGSNLQLGTGEEKDESEPIKVTGKQLATRSVVGVSAGAQHTLVLANESEGGESGGGATTTTNASSISASATTTTDSTKAPSISMDDDSAVPDSVVIDATPALSDSVVSATTTSSAVPSAPIPSDSLVDESDVTATEDVSDALVDSTEDVSDALVDSTVPATDSTFTVVDNEAESEAAVSGTATTASDAAAESTESTAQADAATCSSSYASAASTVPVESVGVTGTVNEGVTSGADGTTGITEDMTTVQTDVDATMTVGTDESTTDGAKESVTDTAAESTTTESN